ncbi:MAG TPA: CHC2 zinc finger domain-containing protein [Candidatus Udaeobacter sp.]|jgi:DNA primase
MSAWIDFKELRARVAFEQVLKHYGIEVRRKGSQHHGFCPLPNHSGKKNSPSFSANLEKGIFQCFGCGAKGNLLEFAAMMQNVDPKDGAAFRAVAGDLQRTLCPELGRSAAKPAEKPVTPKPAEAKSSLPIIVNQPLDFELKGLDTEHPYLLNRGFTRETIGHFGIGFCSRGMLKGRIAIPLHDHDGRLVGYAGRVVDNATISEDNPRYRLPGERIRDGKTFEFRKTLFLYNGFRFKTPLDELIVVEGFASVWWLNQHGLPHAVATMGADCSRKQAELLVSLVKPHGRVWVMTDGNDAGERCALTILGQVSPHRFVRWMKLTNDKQPTDLSAEELKIRLRV